MKNSKNHVLFFPTLIIIQPTNHSYDPAAVVVVVPNTPIINFAVACDGAYRSEEKKIRFHFDRLTFGR